MDILSDILQTLRFHGDKGYNAVLKAPWGVEFPGSEKTSPFYVVARGACLLELPGFGVRSDLSAGDIIMLSRGDPHVLRDGPESKVVEFSRLVQELDEGGETQTLRYGYDGTETVLIAGEFAFDSPFGRPLLKAMDRVVHIKADSDESSGTFAPILKMLCREGRSSEPGSRAARSELLKLLFVHILRFNMAEHKRREQDCHSHPFALMFDRELRGVAEALQSNPERQWTVADMAAQAGMSRTKFSTRFSQVAGVAPLAYLTNLRMMAAADRLERSDATLEKIAESTGYGSEPAFSTAFKREMGMSPGAYRRKRKECPAPALS